jgi:polysaccharide export outer membrane protein
MRNSGGPYRLVTGDLLELQMPAVARLLPNRKGDDTEPYKCRVDSTGRVVLPIVGNLQVGGKTLAEVEAAVAQLYHPKYVHQEPSIVASVAEYRLSSVSVVGAVQAPGVYQLRSNERTVITALMKAGGISDRGATTIHIYGSGAEKERSLTVPVVDANIPAGDVELADGDTVVVEEMQNQAVSVVGLVKNPGMFPWSSKRRLTVMDALAFAGGVNDLADPEYARVYRQNAGGKIVTALLSLSGPCAGGATELCLKPGDIVVVEQTPQTRTRLFLAQILHMGLGVNAGASVGP